MSKYQIDDMDNFCDESAYEDSDDSVPRSRTWITRLHDWFFKPSDAQQNQATDTDTEYQTFNEDQLYLILNGQ